MLSRVADAVFWMARYMERTDNLLRMLRTNYIASQDEILDFQWKNYVKHTVSGIRVDDVDSYREALFVLLLSKENDSSIFTNIVRARENARSVQDYITKELWQNLNDYYHLIRSPETERTIREDDPVTAMDLLLRESTLFYGTVDITMYRGEGYAFLNLGKYIERTLQILDILQLRIQDMGTSPNEAVHWKYVLYSLSGYEFHTKEYKNSLATSDVMDQLFFNTRFPHSVMYALLQTDRYFDRLDALSLPENFKEIKFLIGKSISDLKYRMHPVTEVKYIQELIDVTRTQVVMCSGKLATRYFGYS